MFSNTVLHGLLGCSAQQYYALHNRRILISLSLPWVVFSRLPRQTALFFSMQPRGTVLLFSMLLNVRVCLSAKLMLAFLTPLSRRSCTAWAAAQYVQSECLFLDSECSLQKYTFMLDHGCIRLTAIRVLCWDIF